MFCQCYRVCLKSACFTYHGMFCFLVFNVLFFIQRICHKQGDLDDLEITKYNYYVHIAGSFPISAGRLNIFMLI